MEILFCCCNCCCADTYEERSGSVGIFICLYCCYKGYRENISGHKRRTYRYLNIVLILMLSIVAVILAAVIQSTNSASTSQMKNILENWQQGVLLEIQLSTSCPTNYEIISIYELPGTSEGCICLQDKELFASTCTDWQLLNRCYNFKPKSPIYLKNWVQPLDDSFQEVQICGKRSQLNFYDLLQNQITTAQNCKDNGYKVCQTQNPNNFYCVLQEEPCPIRDFKISRYELSHKELELNGYNLIYSNGFYAYTSQSIEKTPLVSMTIVKGRGVCFDPQKISLNPKLDQDYFLLSPKPENCEIDNTYFQVATTTEKEFFYFNEIEAKLQSERPLYSIGDTIEYQLLAQNQIQYKIECRLNNFQQIINLGQRFDSQNTLITCQLVFACILFFFMFFFSIFEVQPCIQKNCKLCYSKIYNIIKETSIYLLAITVIFSYSYMIDLVENLEEQISRNCFLDSAQERMNSVYRTMVGTSLSLSYCLLINMGIIIIIDFVMTTFLCYKIMKKRKALGTSENKNQNKNEKIYQNKEQNLNQNLDYATNQNFMQNPYLQQQNYQTAAPQCQYGLAPQIQNQQFQQNQNHVQQQIRIESQKEPQVNQQEQKVNIDNLINLKGDKQVVQ
ncbi:unnamed protein product [Paramecium sonneborni]|uniref:Transmembrane protein n=1 Tax=Paramecium sonneborni TaxID=65129 RepID=A0A8S1KSW0_9CILI|nr:unnamed protein product [Paramecium sonneborni]